MSVLSDSQMIVGNGSTDPVAESGATLRTSIGVGTGDAVEFAGITGTTIDATTDFTIGATIITNGVITDSSGLQLAAAVDLNGNTLSNVGASGNDWASTSLSFAAASTVKTAAGVLTVDGDDGLLLKTTGSTGSYITRGTYHISQVVTKTSIADNSATAVFTITTTDGLGNIDGGGYACHVRALVGHTLHATASDFQAAKSFQAPFARAMSTDGAQGNSSAVAEIAESASGVAYAGNTGRRDIGTITMTTADTSEYVQTVSFTVDLTNPGAGGSIGTAEVIAEVDLIYYGFQVAPVIAVA